MSTNAESAASDPQGEASVLAAQWRRVAAYVALRDDSGRLLLTSIRLPGRPGDGKWTMPGGGMDWGEDPLTTARRELIEETGLDAELGRVLGVWSKWFTAEESHNGERLHTLGVVYEARNPVRVAEPVHDVGTTSGAGWFSLDEVRNLPRVELVDFVLALIA
jgi:8-oxo-dGTP diphosphatase